MMTATTNFTVSAGENTLQIRKKANNCHRGLEGLDLENGGLLIAAEGSKGRLIFHSNLVTLMTFTMLIREVTFMILFLKRVK